MYLKKVLEEFKNNLRIYKLVLKDERTPKAAKILLWIAIAYLISPIDLIPDFIPIIGHMDDLVVVTLLVITALKIIPKEVINDNRKKVIEKNLIFNKKGFK